MIREQHGTILVTGGGGFIGSHVAERLLCRGHRVTAFVRYTSTGRAGYLDGLDRSLTKRLTIVYGDIRNRDDIRRASAGAETIIHLAAQIAIPYSYLSPGDFIEVNTIGTLNVLAATREMPCRRIVHLSTSEVYGTAQYLPIDEKHPLTAQSPYAASKIAADKIVESFHRSFGLPVVIARPFNTYGPRQSPRAVIPTIIIQALRGTTIRLGNIGPRRDLSFVEDTADALMKIALSQKGIGGQFNIASGKDYTIAEVVEIIADLVGKRLDIKVERRRVRPRKSEVDHLLGDRSLAAKTFRLKAPTPLRDGLAKTIAWYETHIDSYGEEDYRR